MARKEETALGTARARFVEALPRKASELRGAVALLTASPAAEKPREEMRRRLHALYASAQVFRIEALAGALKESIDRLDHSRDTGHSLVQGDLDALAALAATLPALGDGAPSVGTSSTDVPPSGVDDAITTPGSIDAPLPAPPRAPPDAPPTRSSERPSARPPHAAMKRSTLQGISAGGDGSAIPSLSPARRAGSFTAARASERPPARPLAPLDTIFSVLVVDNVEWQAKIRAALPAERFEMLAASDPEAALQIARTSGPDVVLVDLDVLTRPGVELISRLRGDPLTDFVPVVLLLPEGTANDLLAVGLEGVDETLGKPFDTETLVRTIARVTGSIPDERMSLSGELTLRELADRLADELRRGIVESVELGKDVRVPVGDGSEVLAAAWAAIAKVRAHVARESGGRIRFRDSARRGGPALMALVDDDDTAADLAGDVSLEGRRIIVADDDPAVVWFFAGLLREEGATVFEAADGREAVAEARRRRPDVVISDILMPELDGFGLCRAFERDPALTDVPVILLSWKEDFLQRMRDLSSGARGYLRKEAGTAQILARVREVLRPRARLEAQLEAGGEHRGRIEGVGILTLLRSVAEIRSDARITVRDAWNLFEVDMRGARLVDLTRTATDGSFARGPRALPQLLGVTTGRYTVDHSESAVRATFDTSLAQTIAYGTETLGAIIDAVSGRGLSQAAELGFDRDVLSSFLRTSPDPIRRLVDRLAAGESPRDLLVSSDVAPVVLESTLVDLARRGAIASVAGPDGEDRLALALEERRAGLDLPQERSSVPPAAYEEKDAAIEDHATPEGASDRAASARPVESDAEREARERDDELDWLAGGVAARVEPEKTSEPPADTAAAEERPSRPRKESHPSVELDAPFDRDEPGPASEEGTVPFELTRPSGSGMDAEPTMVDRVETVDEATLEAAPADDGERDTDEAPIEASASKPHWEEETSAPRSIPAAAPSRPSAARVVPKVSDGDPAQVTQEITPTMLVREAARDAAREHAAPTGAGAAVAAAQEPSGSLLQWVVMFVLLVIVGFIGWRVVEGAFLEDEEPAPAPEPATRAPEGTAETPAPAPATPVIPQRGSLLPPNRLPMKMQPALDELAIGRRLPFVDAGPGFTVGPDQGLLVVERSSVPPQPTVSIGERDLGSPPVRAALPEGRHDLYLRRGDEVSFRPVYVRRGQTLVVPAD